MTTALALAGLALGLLAQEPRPAVERTSTPEDLAPLLEPIRAEHGLPALGALVLRGDAVAALGVVGVRKSGDPTPATGGDLWHLGSCTKAMTATLLAVLVEEGKLSWETSVAEVFEQSVPELDADWSLVTLQHLLQHRSGAPRDLAGELWLSLWQREDTPREQRLALVRGVIEDPPLSEPGTVFLYSNAGYAIAGAMAETVMDAAWEDLIRERVFRPLGMQSAGFGAPGSPDALLQPLGHRRDGEGYAPVPPGPNADNPPAIGPAGTVHATLADWARFAAFHLGGARGEGGSEALGKGVLLRPETLGFLHEPPPGGDYALGWGVGAPTAGAGKLLMHRGSNTLWLADIRLAPEKGFAVLLVANAADARANAAFTDAHALLFARELAPR